MGISQEGIKRLLMFLNSFFGKSKNIQGHACLSQEQCVWENMIDIHSHVLYGVDDGVETEEQSLAVCRRLVETGIRHVIVTPHMPWEGKCNTEKIREVYISLQARLLEEQIPLVIHLGADVHIDFDMAERLEDGSLFTLAGSRYFLLELDEYIMPKTLEQCIAQCNARHFIPIITHPERMKMFQASPLFLKDLVQMPVLFQVTASSFAGVFGKEEKQCALDLLKQGYVDIIASDVHACDNRIGFFLKGLEEAVRHSSFSRINQMVTAYPLAVLENKELHVIKPS